MRKRDLNSKSVKHLTKIGQKIYPQNSLYSAREDIYNKAKKESGLNPLDFPVIGKKKGKEKTENKTIKNTNDNLFDTGLDVQGLELDDELEYVGTEEEANNYYSIEGDGLIDLKKKKMKSLSGKSDKTKVLTR